MSETGATGAAATEAAGVDAGVATGVQSEEHDGQEVPDGQEIVEEATQHRHRIVRALLAHRSGSDSGEHRHHARRQHQEDVTRTHPAGVENGERAGVHEPLAHREAGEIGAGQPGALTVEELLERRV